MAMKLWTPTVFLILTTACALFGQEREFPNYNFAIKPPDGWQLLTNGPERRGVVATFCDSAKMRQLDIAVYDHGQSSGPLNDSFVSEFERGFENSGGGKRVSGRFIEVLGIKSYERYGNVVINGKNSPSLTQVIPVKGRLYLLQGVKVEGDASNDLAIRNSMASFRFITPSVVERSLTPEGAAFRTGLFAGFTLVIFAVIWIRRAAAVRKNQRSSALPPLQGH